QPVAELEPDHDEAAVRARRDVDLLQIVVEGRRAGLEGRHVDGLGGARAGGEERQQADARGAREASLHRDPLRGRYHAATPRVNENGDRSRDRSWDRSRVRVAGEICPKKRPGTCPRTCPCTCPRSRPMVAVWLMNP